MDIPLDVWHLVLDQVHPAWWPVTRLCCSLWNKVAMRLLCTSVNVKPADTLALAYWLAATTHEKQALNWLLSRFHRGGILSPTLAIRDEQDRTLLTTAAQSGYLDVVNVLLYQFAFPRLPNNLAADGAANGGHLKILRLLLANGFRLVRVGNLNPAGWHADVHLAHILWTNGCYPGIGSDALVAASEHSDRVRSAEFLQFVVDESIVFLSCKPHGVTLPPRTVGRGIPGVPGMPGPRGLPGVVDEEYRPKDMPFIVLVKNPTCPNFDHLFIS